jgi:hypothetical protein
VRLTGAEPYRLELSFSALLFVCLAAVATNKLRHFVTQRVQLVAVIEAEPLVSPEILVYKTKSDPLAPENRPALQTPLAGDAQQIDIIDAVF